MPDGTGALEVVTSEVINAASSPVTINPSNGFVGGLTPALDGIGKYKLSLQDPYVRLLSVAVTETDTNLTIPFSALIGVVVDDNVNSNTDPYLTLVLDGNAVTSVTKTVLVAVTLANSTAL